MTPSLAGVLLVPLAAMVAPLLGAALKPVLRVPLIVFEILLGVLLGPSILGWVHPDAVTGVLSSFGVAMLFFLAGNEIDFQGIRGRPMRRAIGGWLISLALGVCIGIVLAPSLTTAVFIGVALTSTALGTLMPVLRDEGDLHSEFGRAATATGAAGEFGPLLAISIFLGGRSPVSGALVLAAFAVITGVAILLASRGPYPAFNRLVAATLRTSGQFGVRTVILVLAALSVLSQLLGLDMLLGAFAAGVLSKVLLASARPPDREMVEAKLEAVGFGFLVPVFFVMTGVTFDLSALVSSPRLLLLMAGALVLLLVIRGIPCLLAAPKGSTRTDRASLLLLGATGLPIIVAVTGIGVERHELGSGIASALVGAGMLSVLVFPALALSLRCRSAGGRLTPDPEDVPMQG
ncbi:cation:proton antiporter [Acidipropionibacterium jensenii]|uniref:cation:proton antiporter n=1 Tax=Acidipropionibacterium jensenii TaxID=1749 RepID=UPI002648CD05|nr:cation:proton antiporter [Acidipropionibacterium jensenii]MDN5997159.1 cation:proton antiporter [Acidipropionibacterium jensenii]